MQPVNRVLGIAFALTLGVAMIPAASAGTPVDPDTLNPPPPPGASCQQTGPSTVICQTAVSLPLVGEALFDIGCGTVYETSTSDRFGIRWYTDGNLARRSFRGTLDGTWSLSPDARGTVIEITGNWSTSGYWTVPGDNDTLVQAEHGLLIHATAPGLGASLILAGRIDADGTLHGVNTVDEPIGEISPEAIATLESVLCD